MADDYAKGIQLLKQAIVETDSDQKKQKQLAEQASKHLTKFADDHPDAALALSQLASFFMNAGRTQLQNIDDNSNLRDFKLEQSRRKLERASKHFDQAREINKAVYGKFPKFIDRTTDKDRYDLRRTFESRYIRNQLDLALTTYWRGQTFDRKSPEFQRTLKQAETEFATIHQRYRTQVAGLYARMFQGQSRALTGDERTALGIYNELLSHPGSSPVLVKLQDQVCEYRLTIVNSNSRRDHQLVIVEAKKWLTTAGSRAESSPGLGIRWELAVAQYEEAIKAKNEPARRDSLLKEALANMEIVQKHSPRHRNRAREKLAAINRILK